MAQEIPGRGSIADHARAYIEAAEASDPDAAARALELAQAAIELGGKLADLGSRVAAGGLHLHRRAVDLLELLADEIEPSSGADDAVDDASGGAL